MSSLLATPSAPRGGSTTLRSSSTRKIQTEIHWDPPICIKRHDASTPTSYHSSGADAVESLPLKTRRLLPPSRRVDDGEDEVSIESPPKLSRQSRTKTTPPAQNAANAAAKASAIAENVQSPTSAALKATHNTTTMTMAGTPVGDSSRHSESAAEDLDTFEPINDSPGSRNYMLRMESVRSMASKSMASHSTQAELDFYMRRCHNDDSSTVTNGSRKMATPPQWISSTPHHHHQDATSPSSPLQRRRVHMLAKSAGNMLRSHRPAWDRTESMRSFCSQASSSVAWSVGGQSRSSRKSVASANTNQSRTPTPPHHVRTTSNGTTSKPRRIVTSNPAVVEHAHRPVPAIAHHETSGVTTTAATEALRHMGLADSANNSNNTLLNYSRHSIESRTPQLSLLDDDETASDLWKAKTQAPLLVGPPPFSFGDDDDDDDDHDQLHDENKTTHDDDDDESDDNATAAALGGPWEPQPGGSFMVYRRAH